MESLSKFFYKTNYKMISLVNITVNKVMKPIAEKSYSAIKSMIAIDESKNESTYENLKLKLLKGVEYTTVKPVTKLGVFMNDEQKYFEEQLNNLGIDCNQWCFSSENMEILGNIMNIIAMESSELSQLGKIKRMKLAVAYTVMQKLCRVSVPQLVYGNSEEIKNFDLEALFIEKIKKPEEIKQEDAMIITKAKEEFEHYAKYAHAVYGDFYNKVCSRKQVSTLLKTRSNEDQFLAHCELPKEQLLYSSWDVQSFHPAYCIALDEEKKKIVLCMRGTLDFSDCITDAVGQYIQLKLYFNEKERKFEIKIGQSLYQEKLPSKLQKQASANMEIEEESLENSSYENLKLICKGHAHCGIFFAALDLHKEITPKLEELFMKYSPNEYQFVITGHSLGGGMTQLLTLLYILNPLQYFLDHQCSKNSQDFWLTSYTYGSPPVLSAEFQHLFTGIQYNLIHQNDVVPRISFGTVRDILFAQLAMHQKEKESEENICKKLLSYQFLKIKKFESLTKEKQQEYQNIFQFYKELKLNIMKSKKLVSMGHSFVLNKIEGKKKEFIFEEINDLSYFNSIIFSKSMLTHHFPHRYEEGLENVVICKTQFN